MGEGSAPENILGRGFLDSALAKIIKAGRSALRKVAKTFETFTVSARVEKINGVFQPAAAKVMTKIFENNEKNAKVIANLSSNYVHKPSYKILIEGIRVKKGRPDE